MRLHLVRHAHAGQRLPGGRDRYRPLSPQGRERADALVELFAGVTIDRLLSSPATRCQQTLGSLSRATGLEVEEFPALWEGSDTLTTMTDLECAADQGVQPGHALVACSHGDIIPALIDQLGLRGVPIRGRGCELGSVWVLERSHGSWTEARYVSPRDPLA